MFLQTLSCPLGKILKFLTVFLQNSYPEKLLKAYGFVCWIPSKYPHSTFVSGDLSFIQKQRNIVSPSDNICLASCCGPKVPVTAGGINLCHNQSSQTRAFPSHAGERAHARPRSLKPQSGPGGSERPGWPRDTGRPQSLLAHLSCGPAGGWRWASPGALADGPVGCSPPRVLPGRGPAGGRWRWRLGTGGGVGGRGGHPMLTTTDLEFTETT